MRQVARVLGLLLVWCVAAAAGWWWHRPSDVSKITTAPAVSNASISADAATPSAKVMAARIIETDAMGLSRSSLTAVLSAPAAAAGLAADAVTWRVSALVVRGEEHYALLTAAGLTPLRVKAGDTLPDGDRVKSVLSNRIEIQSPRGRLRALYLIEP